MNSKVFLELTVPRAGPAIRAVITCLAAVTLLALPLALSAGKPNDNGGGGGKPDSPGNGKGDLYADLVVTYRDVDGLPYFVGVPEGVEEEEELAGAVTLRSRSLTTYEMAGYVACEQPITGFAIEDDVYIDDYGNAALVLWSSSILGNPFVNDADGKNVSPVPLGGGGFAGEECDVSVPPNPDYTAFTQEVHFGRLNVGRSPIDVLSGQLEDVLDLLADTTLSWDPAARLMAHGAAVDSPLQSLAVHRELLIRGGLGSSVTLPELPWIDPNDPDLARLTSLELAAAALGAAADKGEYFIPGLVTLDLVVFNNRILQIPGESIFNKIYGDGEIGVNNRPYYDFTMFNYDRGAKYPGCAYGITIDADAFQGYIMDLVFDGETFSAGNVVGFATAADDSRRVIAYEHDTSFFIVLGIDRAGMTDVCEAIGM